ncbi:hypothetical protein KSF78_0009322 [Schistosoma japonicum]|nr:hypothetical protein KSF78_0009322 [Schistosoma japonicum]
MISITQSDIHERIIRLYHKVPSLENHKTLILLSGETPYKHSLDRIQDELLVNQTKRELPSQLTIPSSFLLFLQTPQKPNNAIITQPMPIIAIVIPNGARKK